MAAKSKVGYCVPKKESGVQEPKGGWKQHTWYLVEVSYNANNPVHQGMLYTGFLNGKGGNPGGYSKIFQASAPTDPQEFEAAYYLKVIEKLVTVE